MEWIIIFFGVIAGIIAGAVAGVIPGVHPNLLASIAVAVSGLGFFQGERSIVVGFAVMVVAMSMVNGFVNFVPATYLGAPDDETVTSVLPAHKYMLQGRGHEAVLVTVISALAGVVISCISVPLLLVTLDELEMVVKPTIPWVLGGVTIFLIGREKEARRIGYAIMVTLFAAVLGFFTLNELGIKEPFLPMLSGLFGLPGLIRGVKSQGGIPKQVHSFPKLERAGLTMAMTFVAGSLFSFLPGLGPSQAAVVCASMIKKKAEKMFLMINGGLNTVSMIIGFVTMYVIDKARNGSVVAIGKLIGEIAMSELILFMGVILCVVYPAVLITIIISKKCGEVLGKMNYKKVCYGVIGLIILLTGILSGVKGLIVLGTATAIGMVTAIVDVQRNHLMSCIMVPTVAYYVFSV